MPEYNSRTEIQYNVVEAQIDTEYTMIVQSPVVENGISKVVFVVAASWRLSGLTSATELSGGPVGYIILSRCCCLSFSFIASIRSRFFSIFRAR